MGTSTCHRNWIFSFALWYRAHTTAARREERRAVATQCIGRRFYFLERCRRPVAIENVCQIQTNRLAARETEGAPSFEGAWKRPRAPSAEAPGDLTYESCVHENKTIVQVRHQC